MPGRRLPLLLAAFVALACIAVAPAEAQWKWKDANGRTQYSDVPPPAGTPERDVLQRPGTARALRQTAAPPSVTDAASSVASAGVDPALEAKRRKLDADEAVRTAARLKADENRRAAQQRDTCAQARTQLRTLADGMRIARINANGEREYLDDQARAGETRHAQDVIASDCK